MLLEMLTLGYTILLKLKNMVQLWHCAETPSVDTGLLDFNYNTSWM
jgi:hypothetical protein